MRRRNRSEFFLECSKVLPCEIRISGQLKYTLAIALLQKLCRAEKGRNFVFSPLSLGTALATLLAGLTGDAKTELLQVIGALHENEPHLMSSALLSKEGLPVKMANKFLADKRFGVRHEFESLLKVSFRFRTLRKPPRASNHN